MTSALVAALTRERWEHVNRELVAKLLTELAFEDVLAPRCEELPDGRRAFELALGARLVLRYAGHRRPLGDWRVEPGSLRARLDGEDVALPDAADVVALGAPAVGADPSTAAGLVREIAMTALGDVLGAARGRPAAELLDLDAARSSARCAATRGSSRARAASASAPATCSRTRPRRRSRCGSAGWPPTRDRRRRCVDGLDHATVVREQVGDEDWALLRERAAAAGLDPDAATYLPVHPWQWEHRVLGACTPARSRAASSPGWACSASATCRASRSARSPTPTTPSGATSSSRCRSSTRRSTAACRARARSPRRR